MAASTDNVPLQPVPSLSTATLTAGPVQPALLDTARYSSALRLDLSPLEPKVDEPDYFAGIKKWEDEKEVGSQQIAQSSCLLHSPFFCFRLN